MASFIHPSQGEALAHVLRKQNIDHVLAIKGILFIDGPDYAAIIDEAGIVEPIERVRHVEAVELPLRVAREQGALRYEVLSVGNSPAAHELRAIMDADEARHLPESISEIDAPDVQHDVAFRAMLDVATKEVVGLCFGPKPLPSHAWTYGNELDHVSHDVFMRAIWPIIGDMERANYSQGYCATVFR